MITKNRLYLSIFALSLSFIHISYASFGFLKVFIAHKHENCAKALRTDHRQFCPSFKAVAQCHCMSAGMPQSMCSDMNALYDRMISIFDTQKKACEYQQDTSTQNCLDSWDCYRLGGKNSQGQLCNVTGKACEVKWSG